MIKHTEDREMKKYKAMIVSGNLVLKGFGIIILSVVVTLTSFKLTEKRFSGDDAYIKILSENISAIDTYKRNVSVRNIKNGIEKILLGYIATDSMSVLKGTIPVYRDSEHQGETIEYENVKNIPFEDKYEEMNKKGDDYIIPIENQAPIKAVDLRQKVADGLAVAVVSGNSVGKQDE